MIRVLSVANLSKNTLRISLLKSCKTCVVTPTGLYCQPSKCCKTYTVFPEKGPGYKIDEKNTPLLIINSTYFTAVECALKCPAFTRYDECGTIVTTNLLPTEQPSDPSI